MATVYGYGRAPGTQDSASESAQRLAVETYVRERLSEHTFGAWLCDSSETSRQPLFDRPEGSKLAASLRPGDHIVSYSLDHVFFSFANANQIFDTLRSKGVFIHIMDCDWDTSTPLGSAVFPMLKAMEELGPRHKSIKALSRRQQSGKPYCRENPIGWTTRRDGPEAEYVACRRERKQVAAMCGMRTAGRTIVEIVEAVKRKRRPNGFRWNKNSVSRALRAAAAGFPADFSPAEGDTPAKGHVFPDEVLAALNPIDNRGSGTPSGQ